jgi:hypothetical protein
MRFVQNKNTVYKILPLLYCVFCVQYFYLLLNVLSNYKLDLSNVVCVNANHVIWMFGSAFLLCSSENSCLYRVKNVNVIPKFVP